MQNQNDESDFDDDLYDEVLDENFEDDFDDADLDDVSELDDFDDLMYDESEDGSSSQESSEDFIDPVVVKKSKGGGFNMSFNSMVITGAVILGVCVLVFQLITTEPPKTEERFVSSLNMSGASDGPVFGDDDGKEQNTETNQKDVEQAQTKGFLHEPSTLDSMQIELEDVPPQPSAIISDVPKQPDTNTIEEKIAAIPRPPEDVEVSNNPQSETVSLLETKSESNLLVDTKVPENKKLVKKEIRVEPVNEIPDVSKPLVIPTVKEAVKETKEPLIQNKNPEAIVNQSVIEKLNMIVSRIDAVERQIADIRQTDNVEIESINQGLKTLKQDMQELDRSFTTKTLTSTAKPKPPVAKVKQAAQKTVKQAPVKKKAVSTPKPKIAWEIRAAQPGKAWISKKGHSDIQSVVAGDVVQNIGRVTSVSFTGGRWVIQGTSGRILQ